MSGTPTGTLTAKVVYDVNGAVAEMVKLGQVTDKEGKRMVRQIAEINSIFKTLTASQGTATQAAQQAQQQMAAVHNSAKQTAWAMRTVPAQFTDVFTQLAGGANPMLVLIQQGGQLKDVFGGFGPMFRGLATYITAPMVAVGAFAAAVGSLGFEFYQADQRAKEFQKGLVLTGNFAGMTQGKLTAMAAAVAASTRTTSGSATDSINAVVGSGQFGPQNVQAVAEATSRLERITGDSAQSIVKNFASMSDGVAKWAAEQNKSGTVMNFLTAAQYEQIKSLEEAGKTTEAVTVLMAAYNSRIRDHGIQVSGLSAFWTQATDAFQKYAAAQTSYWRSANVDSELQRMRENEKQLQADLKTTEDRLGSGMIGKYFKGRTETALADVQNAIKALEQSKALQEKVASASAESAQTQRRGIEAQQWADGLLKGAKNANILNEELAKAKANFKALEDAGNPLSAEKQKALLDEIRNKHKPRVEPGVKEGETYLKNLQRQVEQLERGRFEMLRLEAAQKGVTKAAEPYIAKLEAAERLNKRIAAIVEEVAESEKQQGKIDDFIRSYNEAYAAIHREGEEIGKTARELEKLNAMRKIDADFQAKSAGANADTQVKLQQERDKAKQDIADALNKKNDLVDAFKADPNSGITKALREYIENAKDVAAAAENIVVGSLKRAEDAFINFVKTGKLSLGDLFGFMAEEYLRQMFRMKMADAMKGADGGFSLANIFSKAISWGASLFSGHANGLSYVPYDNYPAMLHEGERVQTKAEAMGDRGNAQPISQTFYIGQGVTPQQVQMAMTEARRGAVAQAKGEILQSIRRQGAYAQ